MALKRTRRFRPKRKVGRRYGRKVARRNYRRLPRTVALHHFKRNGFVSQFGMTTTASGYFFGSIFANGLESINYAPSSTVAMPNYSEFTSLFDQYKIINYTVEIIPRWTGLDISGDNSPGLPTIYWLYDTDDSTVPSSISDMMERPYVHKRVIRSTIKLFVRYPCIASMLYRTAVTTGYSAKRSPWIDINDSNVPHMGIKYAIVGTASTNYTFDVKVNWNFACKNPR